MPKTRDVTIILNIAKVRVCMNLNDFWNEHTITAIIP